NKYGIYQADTSAKSYFGGNVGVGITNPSAKLDVAGEVKFGNTFSTCDATNEGQQRYNSTSKQMEFCNGTSWMAFGSFRTSCPSGFTLIGTSGTAEAFCISTAEETGANWIGAVTACYNKTPSAHLCTVAEWTMACVSGLPSSMLDSDWEWVSQMAYVYGGTGTNANGAIAMGANTCSSATNASTNVDRSNTYVSRCCLR
ncbi:hypothetical protein EBR03_09900, partial [bacterium]|nr:hypothetical protein [bacterium]